MMYFPLYLASIMYVLTGAPSVGKTSIIKELEKKQETVIYEAATDLIINGIEMGITEPWKETNFAHNVLKLQREREKPFLCSDGRVFIDRGIFDVYAFSMHLSLPGTATLASINTALDGVDINTHYAAIFLILPYKDSGFFPTKTEIRCENTKEVYELQAALYAIYSKHKHLILVPGDLTPKERADFILQRAHNLENNL